MRSPIRRKLTKSPATHSSHAERQATTAQSAAVSILNVRMTLPWRFPLRHVLRRAPGQRREPERPIGFCPTQPPRHATVVKRDGVGSTAIAYPHPRHTRRSVCGRVRPARWCEPQLACAFPTNLEPARSGLRVYAGHRPATPDPDGRQNRAVLNTPTRYTGGPLTDVSAGQRPSHARGGR
jgi:hypothetical protein